MGAYIQDERRHLQSGNAIISWFSKLNGFVTLSTNHSEYAALALAGREAEWLTILFKDLEPDISITPIPILVDNTGVVSLVFNPVDHKSNKHVKLSCHYARELTDTKIILPRKWQQKTISLTCSRRYSQYLHSRGLLTNLSPPLSSRPA